MTEAVCGPLVEGAFLAQMVAEEMNVEFYFAEQFTRTDSDGIYPLGYRIPQPLRASVRGKRTAIVDDVINAGSAVRGALGDLRDCGAELAAIGALLTLGGAAAALATSQRIPLETLASVRENALWEPSSCPLCASGVQLEGAPRRLVQAASAAEFARYSAACEAGRLRRSRCRNMKLGTIRSISSASIR